MGVVCLSFSEAFDAISHRVLLEQLVVHGWMGMLFIYVKAQRVVVNKLNPAVILR